MNPRPRIRLAGYGDRREATFIVGRRGFRFVISRYRIPGWTDWCGTTRAGDGWVISRPGDFPQEYAAETGRDLLMLYRTPQEAVNGLERDVERGLVPAVWGDPLD